MESKEAEKLCGICLDEDEPVIFTCSKCTTYHMCTSCVRYAFKDSSGSNTECGNCKESCAMEMISAMCGDGAIRSVESKVRSSVEFELKSELLKKERSKKVLKEHHSRALDIFNGIAEDINLKCPRCKTVFNDYDGCNALTCGVPTCKAGFCAICLRDCGSDAHSHVQTCHGNLFDKGAFEKQKVKRTEKIIDSEMKKLKDEPFELKQLVKNHIDRAELIDDGSTPAKRYKSEQFLREAKNSLQQATKIDRLGLLTNPEDYRKLQGRFRLSRDKISPRCTIPEEFKVTMNSMGKNIYSISLAYTLDGEVWRRIPVDKVADTLKDTPNVESVINLVQNLRTAVIAFEGCQELYQSQQAVKPKDRDLGSDELCVSFTSIGGNGTLQNTVDFPPNTTIVGMNPNLRMLLLEKHVKNVPDDQLMFTPLKHLIGDGKPRPVLHEILRDVPATQQTLNEEQRSVAHPLLMKSAMEMAGPPGTGKTKTIVELVRSILECTDDYNIIVLSERNGAINAIAEKFQEESVEMGGRVEIKDVLVWESLLTYGAGDTIGPSTKLFTLEEKLKYHPEVVDLSMKINGFEVASLEVKKRMLGEIAKVIDDFGDKFNVPRAYNRSMEIPKDTCLSSPLLIIRLLQDTVADLEDLLSGTSSLTEEAVKDVVLNRSSLLGGLIDIRTDPEKEENPRSWDKKRNKLLLTAILSTLKPFLKADGFDEDSALALSRRLDDLKRSMRDLKLKLETELPQTARLHMCTIGSSHKLPFVKKDRPNVSVEMLLDRMTLNDEYSDDELDPKKTVVIFDEAGCIPSYELLGLSRLSGIQIESLIVIGDKMQLPPYDPSQGRPNKGQDKSGGIKSLLDVSKLSDTSIDGGKVKLTMQYRVPKDIADILDRRIYNGCYKTHPGVQSTGLNIHHVEQDFQSRKYVNENEVRKGLELVNKLQLEHGISSILIITPYKKQQREFEFQLKKSRLAEKPTVLTIDQCQGQESDAVILSLVQKPTMFLNKNRFNVAISRVRKALHVLVDTSALEKACSNKKWESYLLACDILNKGMQY